MKTRFVIATLVMLCLIEIAAACGPEWTYMGSGTLTTRLHELADSAGVLLRVGNGPGIYRWTGQDTIWELTSQLDRPLYSLMEYPEVPHLLLGMEPTGRLFRSFDNGFTWDTLRSDPLIWPGHNYFTIDPANPTNWYMAGYEPEGCVVERSTDSGVHWEPIWICCGARPMLFSETPGYLYLTSYWGGSLVRCSLADSTLDFLLNLGNGDRIVSTLKHPSQPWIYLFSQNAGSFARIVRYNVETGDTSEFLIPDSSFVTDDYCQMQLAAGLGLFVTTDHDVVLLSEDLRTMTFLTGNLPPGDYINMLYGSADLVIVYVDGQGLFCRTSIDAIAPVHPVNSMALLESYPNPFNSTATLRFELPKTSKVILDVYDLLGRKVTSALPGGSASILGAGEHRLTFDGSGLSSGIYYVRLEAAGQIQTRKMLLIR